MLIVQSARKPAAIRHALLDAIPEHTNEMLLVSAYVTLGGARLLSDAIRRQIGQEQYEQSQKRLMFSLDRGVSEPDALSFWAGEQNASVYLAGIEGLEDGSLGTQAAFHAKTYLAGSAQAEFGGMVCSANMTGRGLTINTEIGWTQENLPGETADEVFASLRPDVVPFTPEILARYVACRAKFEVELENFPEASPVPQPAEIDVASLQTFWDAVSNDAINATAYSQFWVQIDRAEGGSGNQVELPRGANRFFGGVFDNYEAGVVVPILSPTLTAGAKSWRDQPFRWHGDNRMERLNMPTAAQGGYQYPGSALLFRRLGGGRYEFVVAPWDSDLARSWRSASQQDGLVFRVGQGSRRLAGLI